MTNQDFDSLLDRRLKLTRDTLASKSAEYASTEDKLHNFKRAAQIDGISAVRALRGMDLKHRVAVADLVDRYERTGEIPSKALIDEKFGDTINYLILLEALFEDIRQHSVPPAVSHGALDSGISFGVSTSGSGITNITNASHRVPGELVKFADIGARVRRSSQWEWSRQDHLEGSPCAGTIIGSKGWGWTIVEWDNGDSNDYETGVDGIFSLVYASDPLITLYHPPKVPEMP